ncbi:uncharacterized protein PAC_01098 [Phialocephala subalpina]|uniref:Uncharacterized protein n=1 Tax=Phialocephala subalpina TaxID=576137 RepID=A0A1L7WEK3_9HELO|nr:uncharacterized protein PAC_01098 [Phialocephala subalpina]
MPYLNIHWKRYPQHLPKIRVASTPSVSVRNRSTAAARQVTRAPLGRLFEEARERKKQRFFRVRRRRGRSSRASVVEAKRRASQRAKQNIQVFGWDSPNAGIASKATTELYFGSRQSTPRPPKRLPPARPLLHELDAESAIPSTDGAGSSIIRQTFKPKNLDSRYSLMNVAEPPSRPQSRKKFSFESDRLVEGEYAHIGESRRTYDTRIDPRTRAGVRTKAVVPQNRQPIRGGESFKSSQKQKQQQGITSSEFRQAVNSVTLQLKKEGTDTSSIRSIIQSVCSDTSRTTSQRRAVRHFTREIELYLQAARSLPKQSLVPSLSATTISANTIIELIPYQSQFQSTGLAVTSEEQRGVVAVQEFPQPPPTPPKDEKWEMAILSRKSKTDLEAGKNQEKGKAPERGPPSFASGSTGTTVIGFTPPHEKSYPRPKVDRKPPSLESDHTMVGFTPPHEKMIGSPNPQPASSEPKPTTKRSLPWLRRNEQSPEASPTKKMSIAPARGQAPRTSTPLQGWVSTFETANKPVPVVEERVVEPLKSRPETTSRHSSTTKWRETKISSHRTAAENMKQDATAPTQPTQPTPEDPAPCQHCQHGNNYVDTAIQANVLDEPEVSNPETEEPVVERAPLITARNKTFPAPEKKCKGDCTQVTEEIIAEAPPKKSSRPSRVTWQGIEGSTQTEEATPLIDEQPKQTAAVPRKKLSFPPSISVEDRSNTFPIISRTARKPNSVQRAPQMRSPNKSVDYSTPQPAQNNDHTENELSVPPSRQPPSPPLVCSQCVGPMETISLAPELGQTSEEPGFEAETTSKPARAHTCTSRSSILCQQCFPSRQVSEELSPLQASSPVEASYHPSPRRSTRPIIPAGPVKYPEESPDSAEPPPPQTKQCLDSVEGKEMRKKIVQETIEEFAKQRPIADPMKRPSVAKLKLKPAPKPQPAPTRTQNLSTASRTKFQAMAVQKPLLIATACPLDHVASSSASIETLPPKPSQITDKQVFRGLHVATAAACDEDVDKWIEEITGTGVRKFLADLSAFEGLGVNTLANVARRAAKQRREQLRAWEEVREQRIAQSRDTQPETGESLAQSEQEDGLKVEQFIIGDQGVVWMGEEEQRVNDQEEGVLVGDQGVEMEKLRER